MKNVESKQSLAIPKIKRKVIVEFMRFNLDFLIESMVLNVDQKNVMDLNIMGSEV
jgi:hypothetical protein